VLRIVKNSTRILSLAAMLVVALASLFVAASPAQAAYPTPGQFFYIREKDNSSGDHCVDVQGASTVYGTPLVRWDCNQGWNQSFVMIEAGTLYGRHVFRIKPRYTESGGLNICLDAREGRFEPGVILQIWGCNSGWQQLWAYDTFSPDAFRLVAAYTLPGSGHTQMCVEMDGDKNNRGGTARLQYCNGSTKQKFF
jgi:ricin-type beta-trefoil lectin protein